MVDPRLGSCEARCATHPQRARPSGGRGGRFDVTKRRSRDRVQVKFSRGANAIGGVTPINNRRLTRSRPADSARHRRNKRLQQSPGFGRSSASHRGSRRKIRRRSSTFPRPKRDCNAGTLCGLSQWPARSCSRSTYPWPNIASVGGTRSSASGHGCAISWRIKTPSSARGARPCFSYGRDTIAAQQPNARRSCGEKLTAWLSGQ